MRGDGTQGCGEGAREWLWPWWSSSVAAARFGEVGNNEGEGTRGGGRAPGRERKSQTAPAAAWHLQKSRGTGRQPGGGAASVRHAAASVRGEVGDRGGSGGGLGRAAGPGGYQVSAR